MASTVAGATLTERYRRDQLVLRAGFLREFLRIWPLLNPLKLDETAATWIQLVVELVLAFRVKSVDEAIRYYDHFRAAEVGAGLPDPLRFRNLDVVNHNAVITSLAVTGPIGIKYRTGRGEDPVVAAKTALVDASGAASRHVLDGGRDMVTTLVHQDKVAVGFARVTDGNPCYFCAMLASRGPVYVSHESAARTTGRSQRGAGQLYHDHCGCGVEPAFHRDAPWPGRAREFEQLWADSTKGASGKDMIKEFRKRYDAQRPQETP